MDQYLPLIIQLISGAVGGNAAGSLMKKFSLGTLLNSVAGIVGGGLGAGVLKALELDVATGGANVQSVVGSIASGGIGGGALIAVIGLVKNSATMNMMIAAITRVKPTTYMKVGSFRVSIGPGWMPCRFIAARNIAACVEPGIASVSIGIIAPGMQALLAVSEQEIPSKLPLPKSSRFLLLALPTE